MEPITRIKYTQAHMNAGKKYYDANKTELIKKSLERYNNKNKNDVEFQNKRKAYMKEYHKKMKEKITNEKCGETV